MLRVTSLRAKPSEPTGHPLWRLGFRPFYIGSAAVAPAAIGAWIAHIEGVISLPSSMQPVFWHMHEMIFGFACATIVGFLFTAGKTWTGLQTPRGAALVAVFSLWALARVAGLIAPYEVFFLLDAAFLPLAGSIFLDLIIRSRNYRNLPIAAILLSLGALNILSHLTSLGITGLELQTPFRMAVLMVVTLECVIAGRVIPNFTSNGLKGLPIAQFPSRDRVAIALTLLAGANFVVDSQSAATAMFSSMAAIAHFERAIRWKFWRTLSVPLLWILHFSYMWIAIGFTLIALTRFGIGNNSIAMHAFTVGAIGGLIIGMVTRTALGHTGRVLVAARPECVAYSLVLCAAAIRTLLPAALPGAYRLAILASGAMWISAFLIYLIAYTPRLLSARVDGRDG